MREFARQPDFSRESALFESLRSPRINRQKPPRVTVPGLHSPCLAITFSLALPQRTPRRCAEIASPRALRRLWRRSAAVGLPRPAARALRRRPQVSRRCASAYRRRGAFSLSTAKRNAHSHLAGSPCPDAPRPPNSRAHKWTARRRSGSSPAPGRLSSPLRNRVAVAAWRDLSRVGRRRRLHKGRTLVSDGVGGLPVHYPASGPEPGAIWQFDKRPFLSTMGIRTGGDQRRARVTMER
jgi:hypothetical protein